MPADDFERFIPAHRHISVAGRVVAHGLRQAPGRFQRIVRPARQLGDGVLREEFGLNVSDEDLAMMLEIVERRGAKGAPRPFFS